MTGCAWQPAPADLVAGAVRERWLGWVADGTTTRDDASRRLGPPTFAYENGRIYAYRMYLDNPRRRLPTPEIHRVLAMGDEAAVGNFGRINAETRLRAAPTNGETRAGPAGGTRADDDSRLRELSSPASYSLVLVFDARGVLSSHRLMRRMLR